MKAKRVPFIISTICLFIFAICLTSCGVVPCAWVKLDMEGYVIYTTHMYSSGGEHIYLYESEEMAEDDTYHSNYMIAISFYPRILGPDTIEGQRTTTVDISSESEMHVYINKNTSIYSPTKKVYLNGTPLEPTRFDDLSNLLCLTYIDFGLVRGNPNGQINNFINTIEYK